MQTDRMHVRPPLIFIAPFVVGLALQHVYPLPQLPRWTGILLGALFVVPAIVLYVAAQITLHRARTTMLPEGSPRILVASGPLPPDPQSPVPGVAPIVCGCGAGHERAWIAGAAACCCRVDPLWRGQARGMSTGATIRRGVRSLLPDHTKVVVTVVAGGLK